MFGIAAAAATALSVQHVMGIGLPGCGLASPCARAAASPWASVPVINLPVAYLGAAHFVASVIAWAPPVRRRGALGLTRAGAAVSIFFLVVSIGQRLWCPYCLIAHFANLAGWALVEKSRAPVSSASARLSGVFLWSACFVGVLALLVGGERVIRGQRAAGAERALVETQEALARNAGAPESTRLLGRFPAGADDARVRVVVFTDYQCPDCREFDMQSEEVLRERADVSVSIKHFPFCDECNAHAGRTLHANACWAARAAEAAGGLAGPEAFWRMHRRLFERRGGFTDAELRVLVGELGFDADRFIAEMASERTLALVRRDSDDGAALGIGTTPMIFVNGIELKGWNAPGALRRAVESAAAASHAAPAVPPGALDKLIADWREQPVLNVPPVSHPHVIGPANAPVRVVVFGDYQEPNCAAADTLLRRLVGARLEASYEFRHFPIDQSCNPSAKVTLHPLACRMARGAEAAGHAGGARAFWAAHAWIFQHQNDFGEERLIESLSDVGVTREAFNAALAAPGPASRVEQDGRAAQSLGLSAVPLILVNERRVPRWTYEGLPVMEGILARAASGD